MTHLESEPCPFKADDNPIGVFGTCCSYRGNPAALYLLAMGLAPLVFRLYGDKTPDEAVAFASDLFRAVKELRERMTDAMQKPGALKDVSIEAAMVKIPNVGWDFSIGKAFEEFEAAARWHEKIGQMGFGVRAWF